MRQFKNYFTAIFAALYTITTVHFGALTNAQALPSLSTEIKLVSRYAGNGTIELVEQNSGKVASTINSITKVEVAAAEHSLDDFFAARKIQIHGSDVEIINNIENAKPSKMNALLSRLGTAAKNGAKKTASGAKRVKSIAWDKLVHFPVEAIGFYIALAAINWVHMQTDYNSNPVRFAQLNSSQMTLESQIGFYFFMLGAGVASAPLVDLIKEGKINYKRMPFINMYAMAIGSLASSVYHELHTWPGGGFTNLVDCASKSLAGKESKPGDSCDVAYQAWIEKEKMPGLLSAQAPNLIGLVSTIVINGFLQSVATQSMNWLRIQYTAGRLAIEINASSSEGAALASKLLNSSGAAASRVLGRVGVLVPIAMNAAGGIAFRMANVAINAAFFLYTQELIQPYVSEGWMNYSLSRDFNDLETDLLQDFQEIRKSEWKDKQKYQDLKEHIKKLNKRMVAWRANRLSQVTATQQAWTQKIASFSETYTEAEKFYTDYISKLNDRYYSDSAPYYNQKKATHILQLSPLLSGIIPSPKKFDANLDDKAQLESLLLTQQNAILNARIQTLVDAGDYADILLGSTDLPTSIPSRQLPRLQEIIYAFKFDHNPEHLEKYTQTYFNWLGLLQYERSKAKNNVSLGYAYENYLTLLENKTKQAVFQTLANKISQYAYIKERINESNQNTETCDRYFGSNPPTKQKFLDTTKAQIATVLKTEISSVVQNNISLYRLLSEQQQQNINQVLDLLYTNRPATALNKIFELMGLPSDANGFSASAHMLLSIMSFIGEPGSSAAPGMEYLNIYNAFELKQFDQKQNAQGHDATDPLVFKHRWASKTTSSIITNTFTESMIAAMIFGPDIKQRQSSVRYYLPDGDPSHLIEDSYGYPTVFIPPRIIDSRVDYAIANPSSNQPPSQDLSRSIQEIVPSIFNTPIYLKNNVTGKDNVTYKQFNSLYDMLTAGLIRPDILAADNQVYHQWWEGNVETQYIRALNDYQNLYQQNVARIVDAFTSKENAKLNVSSLPNNYLDSALIDVKLNLTIMGEILRDAQKNTKLAAAVDLGAIKSAPISSLNLATGAELAKYKNNTRAIHQQPRKQLIEFLKQNDLMSLTPFVDLYSRQAKDSTPEKYRHTEMTNLLFQDKILNGFEKLSALLKNGLKTRSVIDLQASAIQNFDDCQKMKSSKTASAEEQSKRCFVAPISSISNKTIDESAEEIRKEIKDFESQLGIVLSADGKTIMCQNTNAKNLCNYLTYGQIEVIKTITEYLKTVVNDISITAKAANAVSYVETRDEKGRYQMAECLQRAQASVLSAQSATPSSRAEIQAILGSTCEVKAVDDKNQKTNVKSADSSKQ